MSFPRKSTILCSISQTSGNFSSERLWYMHLSFAYMWYIFSWFLIKKCFGNFLFGHCIIYHNSQNSKRNAKDFQHFPRIAYHPPRKDYFPETPIWAVFHFICFLVPFFSGKFFFYESEIEVEKDIHCRLGTYRFFITGGNAKYKQSTIKHNNCYNE